MAVITISRELGSEGTAIGRKTAEALSNTYVDKYVIENLLTSYGLIQFMDVYESTPSFWTRFDAMSVNIIKMLNQIILGLASRGNMVIQGRGGYVVLAGYADVLNVRIQAPFSIRVRRVMEKEAIADIHQVEELIKENDRLRSSFLQTFYHTQWDVATAFNLVIDTGSVASDLAVTWIVAATRALEERVVGEVEPERVTGMIQVDPVLAEAIAQIQ